MLFKIKQIYFALFCSLVVALSAQQDAQYTQYMFNGLAINPAYAGSQDALNLTLLVRKQWVAIDGAPQTFTFSAHSPLANHPMGVGLQVVNDRIGVFRETSIYGSYTYWLPVGKGRLAMGVQAGMNRISSNLSELTAKDDADNLLDANTQVRTRPNFGTGLYYYTDKGYLGISIPRLLNHEFINVEGNTLFKQVRHFYISGGYVFTLNPNWKVKPNVLVKQVNGAPIEADINVNFLFIERLWLGVSWRSFDSFDFLTQFYITKQLSVGYAYDLTTTRISSFTGGSHEFLVNYLFSLNHGRVINTRYF